jgi:hypothetical protein
MLLITLQVVLLLSSILIPLGAKKAQPHSKPKLRIDTDTKDANYAINENGMLEKIKRTSLSDH